ncbi:MAG: PEP/pyruvate-binding domain-containing protein [Bacilli bacterium]|nr:PEP/pyruvate-binding domain-containing protein [Bacilli bacterium]
MIRLNEFKKYKSVLENIITNKAFRSRMMFEGIEDERFAIELLSYISSLDKEITSSDLDSILEDIRKKTIEYYEKSKEEEVFDKKLSYALRSFAYFYFLESIDEHSILSDGIIEEIKNKYPNDYLDIISKIDKAYLSIDTKEIAQLTGEALSITDDLLKKYIVLKQWQDKQHHFFDNGYGEYLEKQQQKYCENNTMDSFSLEQFTLRKRLFDSLSNKGILDLETCSVISELYIKKFVVEFIGGKMYGLSVLNSKEIKVPFSMVVPTGIDISNEDLKIFDEKYDYYSVRSSADIEDGEKNSFAGMFDSYLNVPTNEILTNINKVKDSINNERLKEYIQVNGLEQPHMAVVIQSFKEPEYAGVWIGNSDDSGVLEWVKGNGEKLVSGSSTPHSEIWNGGQCEKSLTVNDEPIGKKMLEYQQKVGSNADFEWMILDGELIMLQFRPVTKKVIVSNEYGNQTEEDGLFGIPAAPGLVIGEGRYLDSPKDEIVNNKILLAMMTDPDWLPHLMNSKGAVTAYGGFLCHTAIVCRELGIPCVTGIGEDVIEKLINQSENLEVNGNSGKVKALRIK